MLKTDKEKKAEEEGAYKSFGGGIYHTPRKENLTENWRHESRTSRTTS